MAATKPRPRLTDMRPSDSPEYIGTMEMSFDDWVDWDHEGGLSEWVDGTVYFYMSASSEHTRISRFLTAILTNWLAETELGELMLAPYAIRATHGGAGREPDLLVVLNQNAGRVERRYLDGVPDLVVEIVSDESVYRDRVVKFAEYESAGIPEYWLIDPRPGRNEAHAYALVEGHYQELATDDGLMRSRVLPGFWLRLSWLFGVQPKPMSATAEILAGPG